MPSFNSLFESIKANSLLDADKLRWIYKLIYRVESAPGSVAEVGVYRGGTTRFLAECLPNTTIFAYDTFKGQPCKSEIDHHEVGTFNDIKLRDVVTYLEPFKNVELTIGLFPGSAGPRERLNTQFKFVHIDVDQYQSTKDAIEFFYPRMIDGGIILVDDFNWPNCQGVKKAMYEFFAVRPEVVKSDGEALYQAYIIKGFNW